MSNNDNNQISRYISFLPSANNSTNRKMDIKYRLAYGTLGILGSEFNFDKISAIGLNGTFIK